MNKFFLLLTLLAHLYFFKAVGDVAPPPCYDNRYDAALLYHYGVGVKKDIQKAEELYLYSLEKLKKNYLSCNNSEGETQRYIWLHLMKLYSEEKKDCDSSMRVAILYNKYYEAEQRRNVIQIDDLKENLDYLYKEAQEKVYHCLTLSALSSGR